MILSPIFSSMYHALSQNRTFKMYLLLFEIYSAISKWLIIHRFRDFFFIIIIYFFQSSAADIHGTFASSSTQLGENQDSKRSSTSDTNT